MIIIADDITGAAEIAGIAFAQGQQVRLSCDSSVCCDHVATLTTVIATDTRSMTESDAVAETRRIASHLAPRTSNLFKKTDSALRGHVVAELVALMEASGYRRAVYLPANPSKGRIIRGGVYYIKEEREVPIAETAFSYDPEFPARTSSLKERFPDAAAHGIIMPDAETLDDIRRVVSEYDDGQTLFAGAADLFALWLEAANKKASTPLSSPPLSSSLSSNCLILCGSTQSKPLDLGIPASPMPLAVYDGSDDITRWDCSPYDRQPHSLILTMPYTHRTGKTAAVHLRTMMARQAAVLVERHRPDHLIIEGGATAWATLQALGWTQFVIERQVAPGVVQMRAAGGTLVTLKPGSYPWGGLLKTQAT